MSHIFVSYSRKDFDFASKIVQALATNKLDTWIDWKSIPKGEDWEQEIYRGIEEADAFLFLISPDSVASQMCNKEIAHAVNNGKRILPIVIHDADLKTIHPEISKLNWIFCRDGQDDFNKAIEETRETIHTDYEWLKYHTELQVKALKWEQKKDTSRLLREKELYEAEQKLSKISSSEDPQPTKLQREYILASRRSEERQRRQIIIGLSLGLVIMVIISIFALIQRNEAQHQAKISLSRQLAAQAQLYFSKKDEKQQTAVLLAIQSMKIFPLSDAAQILQNNTLAYPVFRIDHFTQNYYGGTHSDYFSVVFSPDGKYVASGGCDEYNYSLDCTQGTARVWKAGTGREIAHLSHPEAVSSIAFSPDGKYVITSDADKAALLWETATGKIISQMVHDGSHLKLIVAFSPDGKSVVSASRDGTARVWEAATGKEIARMTHNSYVRSVAFSSDGNYVVSGGADGNARVWEAATGKEIAHMTHGRDVNSLDFSLDGRYVVSGSADGTARVWEAGTGNEVARMTHDGSVGSVAFSPDGKYVVSGSADGTARVWDSVTGNEISRVTHDASVESVAFSPDGKYVVSGSSVGSTIVWGVFPSKPSAYRPTQINIECHDSNIISPDGKYMVVVQGQVAEVIEISTGEEIAGMLHDKEVRSVAFSPDGKYVVSGSRDRTARVWEAATGNEITRITHDGTVVCVNFSPDGKYVVSGSYDGTARVWDSVTGNEISRTTDIDAVVYAAFSSDGKYVESVGCSNEVTLGGPKCEIKSTHYGMYRPKDLISDACARVARNLTRAEWEQYIRDVLPYQAVCPNLPIEPEITITPTP